jgi:hypothetical protein|tara:strand:- start:58 stop:1008 length:951 start_codon:yes stop_codon:yes gene_type:complete
MAIFKAGKRVGPFDIRLGLSRDKSLENVDRDPRIQQRANSENTIGRFRASMAKAEGYARPTRYLVRLFLPTNLEKMAGIRPDPGKGGGGNRAVSPDAVTMQQLSTQIGDQINLHCDNITMPNHDLQAETIDHYGPTREMVTGHGFTGTINASFYADKFLRERHFMELWQKMAVNMTNHKVGYYNDYIGKLHIYQLGSIANEGDRDRPTYAIEATEVYPAQVGSIDYSYGSNNQIVKINVQFQYKEWFNLATDKIAGVTSGLSDQVIPELAGQPQGLFGNLPPELQRTGRDVLNQAKTVLNPIGKLTKGRVFGPFTR